MNEIDQTAAELRALPADHPRRMRIEAQRWILESGEEVYPDQIADFLVQATEDQRAS